MDKSTPTLSPYPQVPPQMSNVDERVTNAPPSYEQATGSSTTTTIHTRVQVLPPPTTAETLNRQPPSGYAYAPPPATAPYPGTQGVHRTYISQQTVPPVVHQPMVIIQHPTVLPLGPEPAYVTCPACHIQKLTRIEYEPSSKTHLMAALLCILGLWCCVCLPYCSGSCMNANHYCGNCNKFLGSYGGGAF